MMAAYGFSFGVELTVDNNLHGYFQKQFGKSLIASGNLASIFGYAIQFVCLASCTPFSLVCLEIGPSACDKNCYGQFSESASRVFTSAVMV